jgi:HK97 family phage major capsid protein
MEESEHYVKLFDLKAKHKELLDAAQAFVTTSDAANRPMTVAETESMTNCMNEAANINTQIEASVRLNTLRGQMPGGQMVPANESAQVDPAARVLTAEYRRDFQAWAKSRGRVIGASMAIGQDASDAQGFMFPVRSRRASAAAYESGGATGAQYSVPTQWDPNWIPLAVPELGVESIATIVPTEHDVKYFRKTAHGTAAAKAEGTGSGSNLFAGTDPVSDAFTLTANMIGHPEDASWELLQDVNQFQSFVEDDILLSLAILKENWYINGTGTNQAQGLKGNTGAGVTGVAVGTDGYATNTLNACLTVQGVLSAFYHPNATFLMARPTSVLLRAAQKQANLYTPVFTTVNGKDYLYGYPVAYSASMPAVGAASTPILFGDFKRGYIIGHRGGSGVNVKILDQPKALEGLLTVLGYQRIDGRVRRSEAIQAISLT